MKSYLHLFETEQEFNAQYEGSGYTEPWVSYTMETSAVTFNKGGGGHDYSKDYLTFEILSGGNITWSCAHNGPNYSDATAVIQYSKNGGEWANMPRTLSVVAGDMVRFKGDNSTYSSNYDENNSFSEGTTAIFNVNGNIMSLISSTGYTNLDTLETDYTFMRLFCECSGLTDASNLILPATTLASNCYDSMFLNCTSLTTAPALPATTLVDYCYQCMFQYCTSLTAAPELPATTLEYSCYEYMFDRCSNLNYIKAMFLNEPDGTDTYDWVDGVAVNGTFVKNSAAIWDMETVRGSYGIPYNWTVEEASE